RSHFQEMRQALTVSIVERRREPFDMQLLDQLFRRLTDKILHHHVERRLAGFDASRNDVLVHSEAMSFEQRHGCRQEIAVPVIEGQNELGPSRIVSKL